MELTVEEIRAAANGTVSVTQGECGVLLCRFSRVQCDFFEKRHPLFPEPFFDGYFGRNCYSGAGITLDFSCDARELCITLGKMEAQRYAKPPLFDWYVDGKYASSAEMQSAFTLAGDGARHRYTLYFPHYAEVRLASVTLRGASSFVPHQAAPRILFFGDSITQGARATHPSQTYVMQTARMLNVGVLNQGNSGFVYDADSIDAVCSPDVIVTAYGINDYNRKDTERLRRDAVSFLEMTRKVYKNAKILSILPLWTSWDGQDPAFGQDKRKALQEVYAAHSDLTLDGHDLLPHDLAFFDDGLHPTEEGFTLYAEGLASALENLL